MESSDDALRDEAADTILDEKNPIVKEPEKDNDKAENQDKAEALEESKAEEADKESLADEVPDEQKTLKKIPAEVKAFLDAVAAIPEITPDNAEEMSEYLYGEVAQFFEDLLGTEYEDREDVQTAAAAMSEAMKAVDVALEMESELLASGYIPVENDVFGITVNADYMLEYDTQGGSAIDPTNETTSASTANLEITVDEPTRDGYTFLGWSERADAEHPTYKAGDLVVLSWENDGKGDYAGSKDNPVKKTLYAVWEKNGDLDETPEAPKRTDLYGILGEFVEVKCVSEGENLPHEEKTYSTWTGSVDGQYEASVGSVYLTTDGVYKVDVTLYGKVYVGMYGAEPNFGVGKDHKLAENENETKTITLKWDANSEKWKEENGNPKKTVLATFEVVCKEEPDPEAEYTVIHEYYTNDKKDGEIKKTITDKKVNATIKAEEIEKITTYDDKTYEYKLSTPDEIVLKENSEKNVITLRYERTETTKPDPDPNPDPDPGPNPDPGPGPNPDPGPEPTPEPIETKAKYTVEWYDASTNEWIKESETRSGIVDREVSVTEGDKHISGYTFVPKHENNILTALVAEDNRTVLKLYFTKDGEGTVPTPTPDPQPEEITYIVIHEYYTNGTKDGERTLTISGKKVGDTVRASDIGTSTSYDGKLYRHTSTNPEDLVLTKDSDNNVLVLRYDRTVGSNGGGSGGGGGGGSTATNLTGRVHRGTPEPAVTVPGEGAALADIPEGTDIPDEDVPLAAIPETDIPDANVPLAGIPDFMRIPDDDVPLASVPKTGDSSGVWHLMALLSAAGLMAISMLEKKRHQKEK